MKRPAFIKLGFILVFIFFYLIHSSSVIAEDYLPLDTFNAPDGTAIDLYNSAYTASPSGTAIIQNNAVKLTNPNHYDSSFIYNNLNLPDSYCVEADFTVSTLNAKTWFGAVPFDWIRIYNGNHSFVYSIDKNNNVLHMTLLTFNPFGGNGDWYYNNLPLINEPHHIQVCDFAGTVSAYYDNNLLYNLTGKQPATGTLTAFNTNIDPSGYVTVDNLHIYNPLISNTPSPSPTSTPEPTNTPTPTPSPSETPTPTITPTQTPTPTQVKVSKVIIVPGMGASWNRDALLNCKMENYSGRWTMTQIDIVKNTYNPLINEINTAGLTPLMFYYDWRQDPRQTANLLNDFIKNNTSADEKVYLVGHSLGGLVERGYLEKVKENHRIAKMITAGTPFSGSLNAYPAWSAGEIYGDMQWKIAGALIKTACRSKYRFLSDRDIVRTKIPSVAYSLPTFDYLKKNGPGSKFISVTTMDAQNPWLPNNNFISPFFGIPFGTISGKDQQTPIYYIVRQPNKIEKKLGIWLDGKPISTIMNKNGDNTVLVQSSNFTGSQNKTITTDHAGTITSPDALKAIRAFLMLPNADIQSITQTEPTSALVIASDNPGSIQIETSDKQILTDTDGLLIIPNPQDGQYTFKSKWKIRQNKIYVIQILDDDVTLSQDYQFPAFRETVKTFKFDRSLRKADILN